MTDLNSGPIDVAPLGLSIYKDTVSQQHRVRAKQKRRKAYLRRKKAAIKLARHEPSKPKTKKEPAIQSVPEEKPTQAAP